MNEKEREREIERERGSRTMGEEEKSREWYKGKINEKERQREG